MLHLKLKKIENCIQLLADQNIKTEPLRIDEHTKKKFTFLNDPDDLPIELYEL